MKHILATFIAFAMAAGLAQSQETIAYQVPFGTVGGQSDFDGALGLPFDVQSDIQVTKLGVFDSESNGLFRDITARIYDRDTGTEVAMLTFTTADPGDLVGGSRFKTLASPLELSGGFHGIMVARNYGPGEPNGNSGAGGWTTDGSGGAVTFTGQPRYGIGVDYPTSPDTLPANRYAAGTFAFRVITDRPGTPIVSSLASGDGNLTLTWGAVTAPIAAATYKVYRAPTRTGPWSEIATVSAPTTSYVDSGLTNRTEYCYRLKSVDALNVSSGFSSVACNSPFPSSGGTIGWDVPWATFGTQSYAGSLGMDFVVNNPITLTHLGVFDHGSDGIFSTIIARVFDLDNTAVPLAEITFTPGAQGVLYNGSRYLPLGAPLALPHGFRGSIVAVGFNALDPNGNNPPRIWTTNTGGGSLHFNGGGRYGPELLPNDFPSNVDGGPANRYAAGTFEFTQSAPLYPGVPTVSIVEPSLSESAFISWPAITVPLPATRYDIYRSTDGLVFSKIAETSLPEYMDTGLVNGTPYFYRVRSVAAGAEESVDSLTVFTIPILPKAGSAYVVPAGVVGNQAFGGALGMDFQVLRPNDVTHLGCFDSGGDGLFSTINVRLYDIGGPSPVLVAQDTFTNADPGTLFGGSRLKALAAPVRLNIGFRGRIVADGYSAAEPLANNTGQFPLTTNDGITTLTFLTNGYYDLGPGSFPNTLDPGPAHRYAAGTFYFVPVGTGPKNLEIQILGPNVVLTWDGAGVIQQSNTLGGWIDMPGIQSGQGIPLSGPANFYRVRP